MLNEDSLTTQEYNETGIPSLVSNPYSWTKAATVIAVNNPPPIGFSYCDPEGQRVSVTTAHTAHTVHLPVGCALEDTLVATLCLSVPL